MSNSLWPQFLGHNIGVGSLSLLQIFPTQGLDPGLAHGRRILYQLSHQGSPGILEWVAYPLSSGSSQPRNGIRLSCIAGRFLTSWAIREAKARRNYTYIFILTYICKQRHTAKLTNYRQYSFFPNYFSKAFDSNKIIFLQPSLPFPSIFPHCTHWHLVYGIYRFIMYNFSIYLFIHNI